MENLGEREWFFGFVGENAGPFSFSLPGPPVGVSDGHDGQIVADFGDRTKRGDPPHVNNPDTAFHRMTTIVWVPANSTEVEAHFANNNNMR